MAAYCMNRVFNGQDYDGCGKPTIPDTRFCAEHLSEAITKHRTLARRLAAEAYANQIEAEDLERARSAVVNRALR